MKRKNGPRVQRICSLDVWKGEGGEKWNPFSPSNRIKGESFQQSSGEAISRGPPASTNFFFLGVTRTGKIICQHLKKSVLQTGDPFHHSAGNKSEFRYPD
ncbi:hypothetical protein CDAR_20651 [Caerostris darwini]|uniref:Uncharacterized protein n=1 Tax=Caerostris darwini TaxID=1538125 RepID=A0AAV4QGE1_9ARAC|nr:hypothetical protein CDAR_20651 [Caerostris darwini]